VIVELSKLVKERKDLSRDKDMEEAMSYFRKLSEDERMQELAYDELQEDGL